MVEETNHTRSEESKASKNSDDMQDFSDSEDEDVFQDANSDVMIWTKADDEDFKDVFNENKSENLPEHREEDDVPIEFISDNLTPPCEQIYPISHDEDKTLREYIEKQSSLGRIRPTVSPAGAPVFFVEKAVSEEGKPPEKRLVVRAIRV